MRFNISTADGAKHEMIGEPVELPNNCGATFVVHYNPFFVPDWVDEEYDVISLDEARAERFRVTHAATGLRVAGGETIDAAVELAVARMTGKGEEAVRAALERERKKLAAA